MTREDAWGKYRYMDSDGTWEVSSSGTALIKDPMETRRCIQQWPVDVAKKVFERLAKDDVVMLKGSSP